MPKSSRKPQREAHSANKKLVMGDDHGTGAVNPMGKTIRSSMDWSESSTKKTKNPPKSLA